MTFIHEPMLSEEEVLRRSEKRTFLKIFATKIAETYVSELKEILQDIIEAVEIKAGNDISHAEIERIAFEAYKLVVNNVCYSGQKKK